MERGVEASPFSNSDDDEDAWGDDGFGASEDADEKAPESANAEAGQQSKEEVKADVEVSDFVVSPQWPAKGFAPQTFNITACSTPCDLQII